jgi:hypothetical protein
VQQINALYSRQVIEESLEEKAGTLAKVAEFIRVTDLFRAKAIDFIPLKGPLLSYRLYGDATVRKYGDIDILVNPDTVDRARTELMAAGCKEYMSEWPASVNGQKKALKYRHHISFKDPPGDVIIELHWRLSNQQWLNFRDEERFVRENLCTVEFNGNIYKALTPEAELLYLVIHGGAHRWGVLKWLEDIHRYLEIFIFEGGKFCDLVNHFGCHRLVALCNKMLAEYFPGSTLIPGGSHLPGYMVGMAKEAIEGPSCGGPGNIREILRLMPYSLLVYPGVRYKMRVLGMIAGNSLFNGRLSRFFD